MDVQGLGTAGKFGKTLFTAALLAALSSACSFLPIGKGWTQKTIIERGGDIYAVGHSSVRPTLQQAKDEALSQATVEFVRFCRVDVSAFDRSLELYSKDDHGSAFRDEYSSQSQARSQGFVTRSVPVAWEIVPVEGSFRASVLLKVPKQEYERIVSERDVHLSLDAGFYSESADGSFQVLKEGELLRSGEAFAFFVRPSGTCYLYVIQVDGLGKAFKLFPNAEYQTALNPVAGGMECWIPNDKKTFELDETTGRETIYLFASSGKVDELEGDRPTALSGKDIEDLIAIKKMGVARVRDKINPEKIKAPGSKSLDLLELKRKLQAEGDFVYSFWFWHK